ncbi:AraC family transcriptional regulator [Opitutaceae bacterium TAV4]|nr:AraC family transcriptional regulator [Opitutaceae bacterium TAV4]RRK00965.1 AraC family transcriptional regulator [Opitutaceae bacterium TAV3]
MPSRATKHLYLPARDRSFWRNEASAAFPLLYLAWGRRDFHEQGVPVSTHEGWVCVCIEEGTPTIILNDCPIKLAPGQLVFIRENCPYGWARAGHKSCKFLLWMWRRPLRPELADMVDNASVIQKTPVARRPLWNRLHAMCREEILRQDEWSPGWLESCQLQIEVLLLRLMKAVPEEKPVAHRVALALAWMRLHPDSQEPIGRLCDYLGLSQPTLYRLFKNQTGESPLAHFHRIKMNRARELLGNLNVSIKEAAFMLGYRHFNDFSRAYRQHFGHAPSLMR